MREGQQRQQGEQRQQRARARDLGVAPGIYAPGRFNTITDVAGVRVGHASLIEGVDIRTGVTAIVPHEGSLYFDRVPAAVHVGNGFGKLIGSTQVDELGELETPILLTSTLSVWKTADALVEWMLEQPGMAEVRSINPVVGETNDGILNDGRRRPVTPASVRAALAAASDGSVDEGSIGAGVGTVAFGWKGGIGTASRVLPTVAGGHTLGVLVQTNFGGSLLVSGIRVGELLSTQAADAAALAHAEGSVMIVIATDAPVTERNLRRIAARGMMGLSRTGSSAANGSGDYVIAFSTSPRVRRAWDARSHRSEEIANTQMSCLFQAAVEATEEAVYNALFQATTVSGNGRTVQAIPLPRVREILGHSSAA